MTKIRLPFKLYWQEKMLKGVKTCTSRTRRYGKAGDTFHAFEHEFVLVKVEEMPLYDVAVMLYRQEGCESQQEFEDIWAEIHPMKGFTPAQKVWVHHFQVGGEG